MSIAFQKRKDPVVRIALIDSQPIVRAGLRAVVEAERDLELLTEFSEVGEALRPISSLGVEVVILGVRKPVENGIRDLQTLRDSCPDVAIIVFTNLRSAPCLVQSLRAGARAYLLADFDQKELVDAVKTAQRGQSIKVPWDLFLRVIKGLPAPNDQHSLEAGAGLSFGAVRLTSREKEVLTRMATGARYRSIADELGLAESTVKKYAHHVITKLGATNRSTAVINAHRLNILSTPEDEPTQTFPGSR